MEDALEHRLVAASLAGENAASFCCVGPETESLWGVGVITVEGHRREGHAAACSSFLICQMDVREKRAVWGAVEENVASLQLAEKLAYRKVDAPRRGGKGRPKGN